MLKGADPLKDQSYFLASVPGAALRGVLFPLGALRKADVRRAAAEAGVPSAHRRSSAGLCFVGEEAALRRCQCHRSSRKYVPALNRRLPELMRRYFVCICDMQLGPC